MSTTLTNKTPWYKSPWPWFLMAFPAIAVIAGIATFVIAFKTEDSLVSDDYYKEGQEINQRLARDDKARELGLSAQLMVSDDSRAVRVLLNRPVEGALYLKVIHPTIAGHDQQLKLVAQGPTMYAVQLDKPLPSHRWQLEVGDESGQWRLKSEEALQGGAVLSLQPH
ncbi:FixH family protein [Jeongeupia wiesaeckerbachi]|uniref:FixH family protein n=1 Tax=Jeongeupia wiesaeckerbachi TaxID=3051218 RepID=UPI003D806608